MMGKSISDIYRREFGAEIKEPRKDYEDIEGFMPEDGCPYYGDMDMMMIYCSKCVRKECY